MANVSSSNGLEKRPKLRFPGFDEPWEENELSHYLVENTERNRGLAFGKEDVLSVSGEYGVINQIAFQGRSFAGESVADYHVVETDDIVYTKSPLKANPYGIIKVNKGIPGIVSTLYAVYHPLNTVAPRFVDLYFANNLRLNKFLKPLVNIGAKHDMKVNNSFVLTGTVVFPSIGEQQKLVDFFAKLDRRIEAQRKIVEALKKYKRGLSDSLFAHISQSSGCKIVKLGDAFDLLQNNTFSREDLTSELSTVQNIHYGDVLIKYGAIVNIAEDKPPYIKPDIELKKFSSTSYLCDGDIVFADTAEDYTVGKATEIAGANGLSVLSGLHTIPCRPLIKFHPMYLGYYFNSSLFRIQIYPLVQGTKVSSISKGELVKASVYVPALEVQKRIALLLYSMDCRIAMEERKNSALIMARAALLQQLFI